MTQFRREVALFDDKLSREDFFLRRQSAAHQIFIPFFDEQYEMEEGQNQNMIFQLTRKAA